MHSPLTYELQKTMLEDRRRSAAAHRRSRQARQTQPRRATAVPARARRQARAAAALIGLASA